MAKMFGLVLIALCEHVRKDMLGRRRRWFETMMHIHGWNALIEESATATPENVIAGHLLRDWLARGTVASTIVITEVSACQ